MRESNAFFTVIYFLISFSIQAQHIRGTVIDKGSRMPIPDAMISIEELGKMTLTDSLGSWQLSLPVGKYSLKVGNQGYRSVLESDLQVVAGKQLEVVTELSQTSIVLNEVVVKANSLSQLSSILFKPSEMVNLPGNANDPMRMLTMMPGINNAGDDRNDLVVRGNSSIGILFRLEGIEIFNPNHYTSSGNTGGAISALNINVIGDSRFYTGAFPAEFGNVYSGVFDMRFREGNYNKTEVSAEVSNLDANVSIEGPLNKNKASFLVGIRQSVVPVFDMINKRYRELLGATPVYADLSFKLTRRSRRSKSSFWGMGGSSGIDLPPYSGSNYGPFDIRNHSLTASSGVNHIIYIGASSFSFASGVSYLKTHNFQAIGEYESRNKFVDEEISLSSAYTSDTKFNSNNTLRTGVSLRNIKTKLLKDNKQFENDTSQYAGYTIERSYNSLNVFSEWEHSILQKMKITLGLHYFRLSLNDHFRLEPRIQASYALNNKLNAGLAFGEYSKQNPIGVYFAKVLNVDNAITVTFPNTNLDFIKSRQAVFSLDGTAGQINFRTELYYQYFYDVPISKPSQQKWDMLTSVLNSSYYSGDVDPMGIVFDNTGKGYTKGVELMVYFKNINKFSANISGTVFESKYSTRLGWYNSMYNSNYAVKGFVGREFEVNMKNRFRIDLSTTWLGGRRYTPVDFTQSYYNQEMTFNMSKFMGAQFSDYFRIDLRLSYLINHKSFTHSFSIDVRNITNNTNIYYEGYYMVNGLIHKYSIDQIKLFPIATYKIMF